jgi:hypothetical protein
MAASLDCRRQDIERTLARHDTVIVYSTLRAVQWEPWTNRIFPAYFDFWKTRLTLIPRRLIFLCLLVKYESVAGSRVAVRKARLRNNSVRTLIDRLDFSLGEGLAGIVLPELTGISRSDVEHWIRHEYVRRFCDLREYAEEFSQTVDGWYGKSTALPMRDLAGKLADALGYFQNTRCSNEVPTL